MYLVTFPIHATGESRLVFCMTDPRAAGYAGEVAVGVELESPSLCDSSWLTAGSTRVVGQDPDFPHLHRLFQSVGDCLSAGYIHIGPMPVITYRWSEQLLHFVGSN